MICQFTRNRKQDPSRDSAWSQNFMAIRAASNRRTLQIPNGKEAQHHFVILSDRSDKHAEEARSRTFDTDSQCA